MMIAGPGVNVKVGSGVKVINPDGVSVDEGVHCAVPVGEVVAGYMVEVLVEATVPVELFVAGGGEDQVSSIVGSGELVEIPVGSG